MSLFEAKIECLVQRELTYGKKFLPGDIFLYNPCNMQQRTYLRSGRFVELPEEQYDYVYCRQRPKEIQGVKYEYNDKVFVNNLSQKQRFNLVRQGYVKKVIKKEDNKQQYLFGNKPPLEPNKINYLQFAEEKDIDYKDLKEKYNKEYKKELPHHMKPIEDDILEELNKLFPDNIEE